MATFRGFFANSCTDECDAILAAYVNRSDVGIEGKKGKLYLIIFCLFAVLSVSGMTLAAVIAEREQAEHEREQLAREQTTMEARL
jgi:hypothetical protein